MRTIPGGPPKLLVAKPGLDGHSNGAEQIAVAARDAGMEVVYAGIRLTPEQIAASARDEDPDVIGISILSGSHLELVPEVIERCRAEGVDAAIVVGGIIPEADERVARSRRRGGVHAEGFPAGRHHARHRRAGGGGPRPRLTRQHVTHWCAARTATRPGTSWPTTSRTPQTAWDHPPEIDARRDALVIEQVDEVLGRQVAASTLAERRATEPAGRRSKRLTPQRIAS